jgi:hypothetical protein
LRLSRYNHDAPTIHREGPYRFYFYSGDWQEPPHVHVERDASQGKFWLEPVRLADSHGFGASELRRLERMVVTRANEFLRAWHEHFTE